MYINLIRHIFNLIRYILNCPWGNQGQYISNGLSVPTGKTLLQASSANPPWAYRSVILSQLPGDSTRSHLPDPLFRIVTSFPGQTEFKWMPGKTTGVFCFVLNPYLYFQSALYMGKNIKKKKKLATVRTWQKKNRSASECHLRFKPCYVTWSLWQNLWDKWPELVNTLICVHARVQTRSSTPSDRNTRLILNHPRPF